MDSPYSGTQLSTRNPNAFSTSVGTYLSSLFRRTHSFSSGDFRYSPGEMFNSFTICSNEFGNATGRIDPGFVKLRFTERRIMHLSTSDLSTSPGPEDQPNLKMPAQVIFFEPPTRSSQQVIFAWYRGFWSEIWSQPREPVGMQGFGWRWRS